MQSHSFKTGRGGHSNTHTPTQSMKMNFKKGIWSNRKNKIKLWLKSLIKYKWFTWKIVQNNDHKDVHWTQETNGLRKYKKVPNRSHKAKEYMRGVQQQTKWNRRKDQWTLSQGRGTETIEQQK